MPTYDYQCQKCGHRYEVFQSMKDDRLTDCPLETCDGKVKRLLGTGAGIIFKGSGFYETDYRSDSYKKAASADKSSGSSGGSSSGGSGGESKPAAAPAAPASSPAKSDS
jgi:putative FmdB family regulatory protein